MFQISIILAIMILLSSKVILIILIIKHLNTMYDIRKVHLLLHEDLLQIQLNLKKVSNEKMLKEFKDKNINNPTQKKEKSLS